MPSDVSKRLGRITSWKSEGPGLVAATPEGNLQLRFYTDRIVRITISKSSTRNRIRTRSWQNPNR